MRVRVTKNTRGEKCWYKNRIGEVFEVSPYYHFGLNTGDWVGHSFDGSGKDCLIAAEDCEELDELRPKRKLSDLPAYQSQVFVALTEIVHPEFSDEHALALIEKHSKLIAERERRRFEPVATARAIFEMKAVPRDAIGVIRALYDALEPFAALLNSEGLDAIGGGTELRPCVKVQMVRDAQMARSLAEEVYIEKENPNDE